jgi:hypothetical protein
MTTKQEFIEQAKLENKPPQYKIINGEQIELTNAELEASFEAWAEMRVEQEQKMIADNEKKLAKQAVLDKLGLTADEAAALFG